LVERTEDPLLDFTHIDIRGVHMRIELLYKQATDCLVLFENCQVKRGVVLE
jgi:hypothetical protein